MGKRNNSYVGKLNNYHKKITSARVALESYGNSLVEKEKELDGVEGHWKNKERELKGLDEDSDKYVSVTKAVDVLENRRARIEDEIHNLKLKEQSSIERIDSLLKRYSECVLNDSEVWTKKRGSWLGGLERVSTVLMVIGCLFLASLLFTPEITGNIISSSPKKVSFPSGAIFLLSSLVGLHFLFRKLK